MIPGGARSLAQAVGFVVAPDPSQLLADSVRVLHHAALDTPGGPEGALRRVRQFFATQSAPINPDAKEAARSSSSALPSGSADAGSSGLAPLPFGPSVWRRVVFADRVAEDGLAEAILTETRPALFYYGAAALDSPTRRWFTADPERIARVYKSHAEVFALAGRSLRIENDKLCVPGGPAAEAAWEALVGAPVSQPDAFIDRLLTAREGRLAWMYDVVSHVPPAMARHLAGADLTSHDRRVKRLEALADVFAGVAPGWHVRTRPLWRPLLDPALLLGELAVDPDGHIDAPATQAFWTDVLASVDLPATDPGLLRPSASRIDAAWLARRVLLDDAAAQRERLELVLFAQRVIRDAADRAPLDALVAARGFRRARTLALSLERAGIVDVAVYARAMRLANSLERDGTLITTAIVQSALAIVERARLSGAIDGRVATRLVDGLVRPPLGDEQAWLTAVTTWIADMLAPALHPATASTVERKIIAGLSGIASGRAAPPVETRLDWEGQEYRVDVAEAERVRMAAVREAQGGVTLDEALSFSAAVTGLGQPTRERVRAAILAVDGMVPASSRAGRPTRFGESRDTPRVLRRVRTTLAEMERGRDMRRAHRVRDMLAPIARETLAYVLVSLVYAAHLPADDPAVTAGRIHLRHDFGPVRTTAGVRRDAVWSLAEPSSGPGTPWHLRGSLLSLDLALGQLRLRRITEDPPAPTLEASDRQAFIRNVALLNPVGFTDIDRDRLAAAIARGRAWVRSAVPTPESVRTLARRAGLSEGREQALVWRIAHDASGLEDLLSLTELFWVGEPDAPTIDTLDRWGTSLVGVTGQFATRLPRLRAWEDFTGHTGSGLLAARTAELNLRMAEWLAEARLPAQLAPGMLSIAVLELVDRVAVAHPDDWWALVQFVRALPGARFEDYVAALTVDGPLRPLTPEGVL